MVNDQSLEKIISYSINEHGEKLSVLLLDLKSRLEEIGAKVNVMFKISCDKSLGDKVFDLLYDALKEDLLEQGDREIVIETLVDLKIKKKKVCKLIIDEIYEGKCENYWALCDYLYILNQKEFSEDYIKIASNSSLGSSRQMLFLLMGKQKNRIYLETIIKGLNDESVSGHALSALDNFKDESLNLYFKLFIKDKRDWVRKIAISRFK